MEFLYSNYCLFYIIIRNKETLIYESTSFEEISAIDHIILDQ
jgi:hypothetical protein